MVPRLEIACLAILCLTSLVTCNDFNSSQRYDNLTAAFPDLHGWDDKYERPPSIGGQNYTQCCLKAVRESLEIPAGGGRVGWSTAHNWVLGSNGSAITIEEFAKAQFPCGATYDEDHAHGAPLVKVPYTWCNSNCGGWQKSSNSDLNQWVQPFVGFILPSAVFCLSVPRRSILIIANSLFGNHFEHLPFRLKELQEHWRLLFALVKGTEKGKVRKQISFDGAIGAILNLGVYLILASIMMVFRATIAASISLINTVAWVAVVFSCAGPMALSGLYEAALDRIYIHDMNSQLTQEIMNKEKAQETDPEKHQKDETLNAFYQRVHVLYALLVGNLTLPTSLDRADRNVWKDVKFLVDGTHEQKSRRDGTFMGEEETTQMANVTEEQKEEQEKEIKEYKEVTRARLKAMLDCQASFGAVIGAPVVFFVGSFLFSIFENLNKVGDNDTSHALAFGSWWMIIPHVAIVSGCLLAGNNPNTLQVIMCSVDEPYNLPTVKKNRLQNLFGSWWQPYYDSVYTPVPMVERGRNKRRWVEQVAELYHPSPVAQRKAAPGHGTSPSKHQLNSWHWLEIGLIEVVLLGLPFVLAFLTSFYTPPVGLSCRTFTFLLYFLFQVCYIGIWIWEFYVPSLLTPWRPFDDDNNDIEKANTLPDQPLARNSPKESTSEVATSEASTPQATGNVIKFRKVLEWVHGILLAFVIAGSFFTTIFGTFFQIVGLYRNCKCTIPIRYWSSKDISFPISDNTQDAIDYAHKTWLPTGVTSIVLLIVTCYIGWWYQRHWRMRFDEAVEKLFREQKAPPRKIKRALKRTDESQPEHQLSGEVGVVAKDKIPALPSPETANKPATDATPSTSKSGANTIEESPGPVASVAPVAPVAAAIANPSPSEPVQAQAQPKAVLEEGEKSETK